MMNIQFSQNDFIYAARHLVTLILLVMIIQKLFNPTVAENFTEFVAFLANLSVDTNLSVLNPLLYSIIFVEIGFIIGIYFSPSFDFAIYMAVILICSQIIASLYSIVIGLQSSCSYGLFGENPYLLLVQQGVLLLLISTVGILKRHYFITKGQEKFVST